MNEKILMISPNQIIGDSRVIKTASSLQQAGYDVYLIGMNKINKSENIDGFPFRTILAPNPAAEMRKRKVYFDLNGNMDGYAFVEVLADTILGVLPKIKFDFIHSHDMHGLPVAGHLRERCDVLNDAFWIHDVHEYTEGSTHLASHKRAYAKSLEEKFIRLPDVRVTVSPILAEILSSTYLVDPVPIVLNCPAIADFDPSRSDTVRKRLKLTEQQTLAVYSGNVKPERGLDIFLELMHRRRDLNLAVLTNLNNPYLETVKNKARELGIGNRLHFIDYLKPSEVSSFLKDATFGIRTSTAYPNADLALDTKLFEYIHAGIPVVSSDTTMMQRFFSNHDVGELFEIKNLESLDSAVERLLAKCRLNSYKSEALKEIASNYSWENQEKILLEIYRRGRQASVSIKVPRLESQSELTHDAVLSPSVEWFSNQYTLVTAAIELSLAGDKAQAINLLLQALKRDPTDLLILYQILELNKFYNPKKIKVLAELVRESFQNFLLNSKEAFNSGVLLNMLSEINLAFSCRVVPPLVKKRILERPRIVIVTALWGRHELSKIVLSHYTEMRNRLKSHVELKLLAVGSEGRISRSIALSNSFDYIEFPNSFLSDKWNFAVESLKPASIDGIITVGSDDLMSDELLLRQLAYIKKGVNSLGVIDCYFYDKKSTECIHWKGYTERDLISAERGAKPRLGESIGAGRFYSREVLELLDYKLWSPRISKGLDRTAYEKLERLGFFSIEASRLQRNAQEKSVVERGHILMAQDPASPGIVDIKSFQTVTPFENYKRSNNFSYILDPETLLSASFPKALVEAVIVSPL